MVRLNVLPARGRHKAWATSASRRPFRQTAFIDFGLSPALALVTASVRGGGQTNDGHRSAGEYLLPPGRAKQTSLAAILPAYTTTKAVMSSPSEAS